MMDRTPRLRIALLRLWVGLCLLGPPGCGLPREASTTVGTASRPTGTTTPATARSAHDAQHPGPGPEPAAPARPEAWATPLQLPGVPNLHRVSDALYRSAQPSAEGMAALAGLGVATVVNLRSFHSDRDEIGATGLAYEHLYMKAWHPEWKEAVRFLRIVSDPRRQPVLVHCQHGADRTGALTAVYRMAVQGWTREEALAEMTGGGFGYHTVWANLPRWIAELDVEALRREAGLDG